MLPIASAIAVSVIVEPNRSIFFSNGRAKYRSGVSTGLTSLTSASLFRTGKSGLASFTNLTISSSFPLTGIPTTPILPSRQILFSTATSFAGALISRRKEVVEADRSNTCRDQVIAPLGAAQTNARPPN